MSLLAHVRAATFVATLALTASSSAAPALEQNQDDWLRGSGKDLEICLKGEIFESDGRPATNVQVTGRLNDSIASQQLAPSVDGNRFKIWIPINQLDWYSMWLKATSTKNDRIGYKTFSQY